ncbi:MAG: phosphotransferase [Actinomycetota bacterium]
MTIERPERIREFVGPGEWTPYSAPPTDADPGPGWIDHTHAGPSWIVGRYLVRRHPDRPEAATEERDRTRWLRAAFGADEADHGCSVPGWYARPQPSGAPAHRPDAHARPDAIPAAVGRMLGRLHGLDPAGCPTRFDHDDLVADIGRRVDEGQLRPELLPTPYERYPAARLLELLDHGPAPSGRPVVGHGSANLANFWIDPAAGSEPAPDGADGFVGLHRLGLADRHADLAVVHHQLQLAYGPEAVFAFYESYACDPQLVALDHYLLVDAIQSALVP